MMPSDTSSLMLDPVAPTSPQQKPKVPGTPSAAMGAPATPPGAPPAVPSNPITGLVGGLGGDAGKANDWWQSAQPPAQATGPAATGTTTLTMPDTLFKPTLGTGNGGPSGTPPIPLASQGSAQNVQDLLDQAVNKLGTVDRTQLGQDMFNQFAKESKPVYDAALRSAAQEGAAAGRVGSGGLRERFGNLALDRAQQLQNAQQDFMNQALGGSISDTQNAVSQLGGLQAQNFGQANTLDQEAIQNALNQYFAELGGQNQSFNQGLAMTQLGLSTNPASKDLLASSQLSTNPSDIAALAKQLEQASQHPFSLPPTKVPTGTPSPTGTPVVMS